MTELTCRLGEAQLSRPSQPTRGPGVFFPTPAPPSCSVESHRASRARRRRYGPHLPLPKPLDAPRHSWTSHASIPPPPIASPPLHSSPARDPESTAGHGHGDSQPELELAAGTLSIVFA